MFQYFLKVVSTKFITLAGEELSTHQYSVTEYERDLSKGNKPGKDDLGHQTSHSYAGVPGLFFSYEISPMLVIHTQTRQSFAHFLTDTCAIVGGVLTVAGLIVRALDLLVGWFEAVRTGLAGLRGPEQAEGGQNGRGPRLFGAEWQVDVGARVAVHSDEIHGIFVVDWRAFAPTNLPDCNFDRTRRLREVTAKNHCHPRSISDVLETRSLAVASSQKMSTALTLIVACSNKNGIGKDGKLPWRLQKEMSYFVRVTTTHPPGTKNALIMGRTTFESIPPRFRPLKERISIVVTSRPLEPMFVCLCQSRLLEMLLQEGHLRRRQLGERRQASEQPQEPLHPSRVRHRRRTAVQVRPRVPCHRSRSPHAHPRAGLRVRYLLSSH
jgi:hypothetical protein